jgi:hypothetical protein
MSTLIACAELSPEWRRHLEVVAAKA